MIKNCANCRFCYDKHMTNGINFGRCENVNVLYIKGDKQIYIDIGICDYFECLDNNVLKEELDET